MNDEASDTAPSDEVALGGRLTQPLAEASGASGAPLRNGTTRPGVSTRIKRGNSLDVLSQGSSELAQDNPAPPQARRQHWTRAMNTSLINAYYEATEGGTQTKKYAAKLVELWTKTYPDKQFTGKHLIAQIKNIKSRKLLSPDELEAMKADSVRKSPTQTINNIRRSIQRRSLQPQQERSPQPQRERSPQSQHEIISQPQQEVTKDNEATLGIHALFQEINIQWEGVEITSKPKISKLNTNKETSAMMKTIDETLDETFNNSTSLEELCHKELNNKNDNTDITHTEWVTNLTNTTIPKTVMEVLSLGPNYSKEYKTKDIPITDIVASLETAIMNLEPETQKKIRTDITNTITNFKHKNSKKNREQVILNKKIKETTVFLKNNPQLTILKPDKSNKTVIMNKKKPELVPGFMTAGLTYMLTKGAESKDPKNYRPVTCLPTIYKLLTGVLTRHINNHVRSHNILATEQNGCKSKAMGAKELLITDVIITKHARKKLRNISVAWVDYKKAFDSVPHTWLLKVLSMYGVCGSVINLLKHLMSEWRTSLILKTGATIIKTAHIAIRRGLFQGDPLSPLWFCLSKLINEQKYGYILDKNRKIKITHQLYIDDLKLYASNEEQLEKMLEIVATFSETIRMEMGLDKCARLKVKRGKISENDSNILNPNAIQNLGMDETYKYLGIQQALEIKNAEMKEAFSKKLFHRVNQVLQSKLNSKSLFLALNTWALPIMTYTFGVLTWSTTELQALDTKIRTILTKYGVHHPHSSVARLYLQRHLGGRGMLNLETSHNKSVIKLREYFMKQNLPFVRALRSVDVGCSPLRLSDSDFALPIRTQQNLQEEWKAKVLHGRYPNNLDNSNVNKKESLTYLKAGYLFPETEGRLLAIQDQVIPTRSYLKNIAGQQLTSDLCRKCKLRREHIQHVTSGCSILAPREYTDRHNQMAKVYHQAMALKLKLVKTKRKDHLYSPENVLENEEFKLYWDTTIVTDRPVANNRPDIVLLNKTEKSCEIIDITVPSDDSISRAYTEKITKYFDLSFELKEMYKLKKISIIPLVMSVNGLVEEHLVDNTKMLELDIYVVSSAQKEVILGNTRIVRRFFHSS
ncbi:uncharacterized protein LOC123680863 [Harmonia axyridis]|uniref:uncharacterized protein LOC123680863 n=1 Tax=Harmonia axyridis TaxID=115357 RepID=UPI001E275739|nr:uncharacterized protein LOC123680863 [Harmonia axyridis]